MQENQQQLLAEKQRRKEERARERENQPGEGKGEGEGEGERERDSSSEEEEEEEEERAPAPRAERKKVKAAARQPKPKKVLEAQAVSTDALREARLSHRHVEPGTPPPPAPSTATTTSPPASSFTSSPSSSSSTTTTTTSTSSSSPLGARRSTPPGRSCPSTPARPSHQASSSSVPSSASSPELFGRPNPLTVEPFASMPAHVKLQAVKQLLAKVNSIAKAMEAKANSSTSRSRDRYDFTMHPLDPERPHQSFEVVPPNRAQPSVRWSGTGEAGDEGAFSFFPFTFSPVDLAAVDVERDQREIERQETRAKAQGQAKAKAKTERRTGQAFPFPVVYRHELKRWRKLAAVCPYIDKGDKSQCTATIKYERPGRYYVILTYFATKQPLKAKHPCSHASVVALDPGVRVFQTTYDLQGRAREYGRTSQRRTNAQREAQRRERRRRQRWRKRQKEKGTEQQKERRRRQKERKRRRGKEAEMEASTPTTGTPQQRGRADDRSRAESGRASAPDEGEEEKEKAWVVQVQRSSSPLAEPKLERPSQPARLQGPIDDVGTGEREEETTPSVRKRKNKVKRVNKRRGAARLYALALRIDQLQSDLATGAHLQRLGLGVVPSSNPASDTSTSPSSPTATTTSTSSSSSPTSPTSSPTSSPTTSPTFPTSPTSSPTPTTSPNPTPTPIKNKKPRPRRRKKPPPTFSHLLDPSKRKQLRRFKRNRRRRLRRLISRLQRRIEQVRGTVHHQCARELTERYDHILIPSFSTSQMVQKGGAGRRINKVTVRQMLGWAHYRFPSAPAAAGGAARGDGARRVRGLHVQVVRPLRSTAPLAGRQPHVPLSSPSLRLPQRARRARRPQHHGDDRGEVRGHRGGAGAARWDRRSAAAAAAAAGSQSSSSSASSSGTRWQGGEAAAASSSSSSSSSSSASSSASSSSTRWQRGEAAAASTSSSSRAGRGGG